MAPEFTCTTLLALFHILLSRQTSPLFLSLSEPNGSYKRHPTLSRETSNAKDLTTSGQASAPIFNIHINPYAWLTILPRTISSSRFWRLTTQSGLYYTFLFTSLILIDSFLHLQPHTRAAAYIFLHVVFAPLHMQWTWTMISPRHVEPPPFFYVGRLWSESEGLVLPAVVHAAAQVVSVGALGTMITSLPALHFDWRSVSRVLAIPTAAVIVLVCFIVPTAIKLARVEAGLLPTERGCFDCGRMVDEVDGKSVVNGMYSPFVRAVRSIDGRGVRRVVVQ